MAVWRRGKPMELLHHSDQGSQGGFNRSSQHLKFKELQWEKQGMADVGEELVRH